MSAELPLSDEDVAEIVSILDRTPYDRISVRTNRFSLGVVRSGAGWTQDWDFSTTEVESFSNKTLMSDPGVAEPITADVEAAGFQLVKALLPGTFYRAPQPGAAPFIEVGSAVESDSVVGIIETMKLMTPVHAGVKGTVAAILVGNAAVVEAQAALIRIKATDT